RSALTPCAVGGAAVEGVVRRAGPLRPQRANEAVSPKIDPAREAAVGGKRPAVGGEDADRNSRENAGDPAEDAGLGAVRMQNLGPLPPTEPDQLDEPERITERVDPA